MYALLSSEVPHLVRDLALVLGVAAITSVLFQKWRQPLVLGYLLAGAILGPNIPVPLHVYDETVLRDLSELGVTLVVFCIGLEFSLSRIGTMGAGALIATSVEMGLQLLLGVLIGHALGLDPRGGLFLGTLIAVSSTMLVQRVLNERTKDPRLRELVLGLLVVEDLGVILLLAILSAFSSGAEASWSEVGITTLKLGVFLVSTLAIGMWLLPQAWLAVLRLRRKETTIVFALGVCFFFALVASAAGFSSALGAFLAGSILAQAGAGHEIERRIEGVRDMFAAVFFVTVGMLVDPDVLLEHAGLVALLFGVVVVGKFFGVGLGTFLSGADRPVALRAGLAMGQIGEFGFVVAGMGVSSQFLPAHYSSVAVAVCALSAFTAPLFLSHADSIAAGVERVLPRRLETLGSLYSAWLAQLRASGARDVRYGAQRKLLRALALDLGALALLVGATGTLYARGPRGRRCRALAVGSGARPASLSPCVGAHTQACPRDGAEGSATCAGPHGCSGHTAPLAGNGCASGSLAGRSHTIGGTGRTIPAGVGFASGGVGGGDPVGVVGVACCHAVGWPRARGSRSDRGGVGAIARQSSGRGALAAALAWYRRVARSSARQRQSLLWCHLARARAGQWLWCTSVCRHARNRTHHHAG